METGAQFFEFRMGKEKRLEVTNNMDDLNELHIALRWMTKDVAQVKVTGYHVAVGKLRSLHFTCGY